MRTSYWSSLMAASKDVSPHRGPHPPCKCGSLGVIFGPWHLGFSTGSGLWTAPLRHATRHFRASLSSLDLHEFAVCRSSEHLWSW